jgi:hypothetical protein
MIHTQTTLRKMQSKKLLLIIWILSILFILPTIYYFTYLTTLNQLNDDDNDGVGDLKQQQRSERISNAVRLRVRSDYVGDLSGFDDKSNDEEPNDAEWISLREQLLHTKEDGDQYVKFVNARKAEAKEMAELFRIVSSGEELPSDA